MPGPTLLLLLACQDQGLTKYNSLPEADILSPEDGSGAVEGDTVALRGAVSDANDDPEDLTVTWYAGAATICEPTTPDEDGGTSCTWEADTSGDALRLEVTDPEGAADSASITVQVVPDEAPVVSIVAPTEDGAYFAGTLVELDAEVTDPESGPDELSATWTSDRDGTLDVSGVAADGHSRGAVDLSEGEHYLTFTATDPQGKTSTDTVIITVDPPDTAPECGILSPDDVTTVPAGTELVFTATATDIDEPAEALVVDWSSDRDGTLGTSTPASDGSLTFATDLLSVGTHSVTMTVTDTPGATCADNVTIVVTGAPAVSIDAPIDGEIVLEGDAVTFEATVSDDEDVASDLAISWVSDRDGTLSTASADSTGHVAFTTDALTAGTHVVTLTATDSDGQYTVASIDLVVDAVPSAPSISLTPSDPATDDELVASIDVASVDPDGDPVSYRYDWYVDGVLSGASTVAILPASATARDQVWTLVVTPTDGIGDGPSASADVTIADTAPVVDSVTLVPDPAYTTDTLVATVSDSDLDGDTVTTSLVWTVDGAVAGTGSSLSGSAFAKGQDVVVTATPSDGTLTGAAVSSTTLTIQNSPPGAPVAALDPTAPAEGAQDLVCTVATAADDADDDAVTYTVTWTVDGVAWTGDTATTTWADDTIPAENLLEGETWACTLTPDDGETVGSESTASATVASCPYGLSVLCPADSCQDAYDNGDTTDGEHWIDPGTGAVEVWCDQTTDGGGWTLVAVVSDDGTDTWTYARRRYWDTDSTTFGSLSALDHDYKSNTLHDLDFSDVLFTHQPSGAFAAYYSVGSGSQSLADVIAGYGDEYCYHGSSRGFSADAGSVAASSSLCEATLYFNAADHDGTGSCSCSGCDDDAYGPTWSADVGEGCPFDDPGTSSSLGPDGGDTTGESAALGFADPLGLNTGTAGAAENYMWVLVR